MSRPTVLVPEHAFCDSVFMEITRDFRSMLKATKHVLGDKHMMTTVCLHACVFPTDRMSLRMVWEQFQALPVAQRAEILQVFRNRHL